VVRADHSLGRQPLQALRNCGRRQADPAAKLGERQARIVLQLAEDAAIRPVQRRIAAVAP
jgi:hypothetical protein